MDWWNVFNLTAGIASIFGGVFSLWQARKSRRAAELAQEIKTQLLNNKATSEVTELTSLHKKAQRSMEKFGPGAIPSRLTGITPTTETSDVQDFYALLKQYRIFFVKSDDFFVDDYCNQLNTSLETFAQSTNEENLRKTGKDLYVLLVNISPVLKSLMDEKITKTY